MITFLYVFLSIILITIYPWFKASLQQLLMDVVLEVIIPIIKVLMKFIRWVTPRKNKRRSS